MKAEEEERKVERLGPDISSLGVVVAPVALCGANVAPLCWCSASTHCRFVCQVPPAGAFGCRGAGQVGFAEAPPIRVWIPTLCSLVAGATSSTTFVCYSWDLPLMTDGCH